MSNNFQKYFQTGVTLFQLEQIAGKSFREKLKPYDDFGWKEYEQIIAGYDLAKEVHQKIMVAERQKEIDELRGKKNAKTRSLD